MNGEARIKMIKKVQRMYDGQDNEVDKIDRGQWCGCLVGTI